MHTNDNDKVPLFKSWKGWYTAVVVWLVVLVILFALFTKNYS